MTAVLTRFNALRDLIPHKDKMDKATFLQQTVEYIKQLQAVMHQLLAMGAIKSLPEETQWSIRLLLPRKTEDVNIPAPPPAAPVQMPSAVQQMPAPTPVPGNPPASAMMASPAQYLPYLLQQPQGQPQQQQPQQVPQGQGQGMMNQGQLQVRPDSLAGGSFDAGHNSCKYSRTASALISDSSHWPDFVTVLQNCNVRLYCK